MERACMHGGAGPAGGGRRPQARAPRRTRGGRGCSLGALCVAVLVGAVGSSEVPLVLLSAGTYPDARCMDGTQGGFYFQPALDPASRGKWVVHLQGGGECSNEDECTARLLSAYSSSDYFLPYVNFSWTPDDPVPEPDAYMAAWGGRGAGQMRGGVQPLQDRVRDVDPTTLETWLKYGWWALGDLNTTNPHLWGWNHVLVPYCSQDLHSGQRAGSTHVGKMKEVYFSGHWILEGILSELDRRGLKGAETILLTGHSAGGMGTFLHADWLTQRYSTAQVLAAPIAGFYFFASIFDGKGATTGTPECGLSDFSRTAWPSHWQLWASFVDFSCAFDLNDRPWECMVGNVSYSYIDTPMFLTQAQTDQIVLELHDCLPSPKHGAWDPDADKFIKDWHKNMSDAVHLVLKAKKGWGLFSPACYTHVNFTATHPMIKKLSFLDALYTWMKSTSGKKPASFVVEDDCGEFCNPTCLLPGKKQGKKLLPGASISPFWSLSAAHKRLLGLFRWREDTNSALGDSPDVGLRVVSTGF